MLNGSNGHGRNGYHKAKEAVVLSPDEFPYDDEAEQAVLGSLLIDPDSYGYIRPIVNTEDFYLQRHKWIYDTVTTIIEGGDTPDLMTVADRLNRKEKAPESGWEIYLMGLLDVVPTSLNAPSYAKIVQEYAIRRRMINVSRMIATHAYNIAMPVDQSLAEVEQAATNLRGQRADDGVVSAKEATRDFLDRLEMLREADSDMPGLPTGYTDLDRILGGLEVQPYLLAARPAMGKSSLALNIAINVAMRKKRVMFFSLEMSQQQLIARGVSYLSGIPLRSVKIPRHLTPVQMEDVYRWSGVVSTLDITIDPTAGNIPSIIRARALRQVTQGGLDLVIIDHMHNMDYEGSLVGNNLLTAISKDISRLPKILGCPVLTLAQLSREVENRQDKRPILKDLRDSGSLEQDAYGVIFLFRDEYYTEDMSEKKGIGEVHVAKNRDGELGRCELFWHAETTSFRPLAKATVQL